MAVTCLHVLMTYHSLTLESRQPNVTGKSRWGSPAKVLAMMGRGLWPSAQRAGEASPHPAGATVLISSTETPFFCPGHAWLPCPAPAPAWGFRPSQGPALGMLPGRSEDAISLDGHALSLGGSWLHHPQQQGLDHDLSILSTFIDIP